MSKLNLIIQREFLAKVRNKSFIIMTFLSPVLMIGIGFLIFFLTKKNDEKIKNIVFVDHSELFSKEIFKDHKEIKYTDLTPLGIEEVKQKVQEGNYDGVLWIPKKKSLEEIENSVQFYSNESPNLFIIKDIELVIETHLRNLKLNNFGIDAQKIEASKFDVTVKMFNFSGEESSKLINGLKIGVGAIAGYLLMMFVVIYGTSVMRSVIEEKTSRIIEIIVSSVKPFYLMLGKILGNAFAGLLQFFIWGLLLLILSSVISAITGIGFIEMQSAKVPTEQLEMAQQISNAEHSEIDHFIGEIFKLPLVTLFILFIFYFLGGFMLYSSFYAAVGAAVDNETDTQQFIFPIILPLILGVYVGFATVINDPHGPVATIFSIVPFTSPIVMLMRVPFGVPWYQLVISMGLLLLTFVGVVWLAAKIYRVGVLMYGKKPTYKDLWKWMSY